MLLFSTRAPAAGAGPAVHPRAHVRFRLLGDTGVQVSRFGLGTMVLGVWGNRDLAECGRIIHRALDAGINLIDTADVGAGENEVIVGRAIAGRRDDVVLATKFHGAMGDDVNRRATPDAG